MRIACVHIHNMAVQLAVLNSPGIRGPLIIGGQPFEAEPVCAASPEAIACGVKPGMPLREAYALCPEARFVPTEEGKLKQALDDVVSVLDNFSPVVEAREDGSAFLNVTGVPDETRLSAEMLATISKMTGLKACLGISDGKFYARCAALSSRPETPAIIESGRESDFIAPFAIDMLPCSTKTKERLRVLGIRFIGQLRRFPQDALLTQFGSEGYTLHNLAHGVDPSPLVPVKKADILTGTEEFCPPAETRDEILQSCRVILERLSPEMKAIGKLCREVRIKVVFPSNDSRESRLFLKEALASQFDLLARVRNWLESTAFPAPVLSIGLSLSLVRETGRMMPLLPRQGKAAREWNRMAADLKARFGYQPIKRVVTLDPEELLPERRSKLIEISESE